MWRAGKGKRKGTRQTHPGVLERAGPQCQLPSQGRVLSWPTLGGCGFSSAAYKAPREKGGLFWTGKDKGLTQGRKKSKKFPAGHKNTSFELNLVQFQQAGLLQGLGWGGGRGGMRVWSMTEGRHGLGADRTPSPPFPWMAPGASSRPWAPQGSGWLTPRLRGREGRRDQRWPSLVLQAATELPPAPLPSPTACLEAEGLQLILKGLMVHGPVVLGLTEGRVLWEELLIAALEDIHLRIVEAGIVVGGSVALPDETAHAGTALR